MATLARIEISGMTISAEPRFETIPEKETSSPVSVSFVLNNGTTNGGKPASMFPVKMKLSMKKLFQMSILTFKWLDLISNDKKGMRLDQWPIL